MAETYDRAGQLAKAETIYRSLLEQARQQLGPDDPRRAGLMAELGLNLLRQHKDRDAEPLLRDCLQVRQAKQPDDWTTFNTQSLLGEALLGQKKYADAEPLLVKGYEGLKQRQDKIPAAYKKVRLTEALERLVRLYKSTNQPDKTGQWRKKLEEIQAPKKDAAK
jgi:hypothetical protein